MKKELKIAFLCFLWGTISTRFLFGFTMNLGTSVESFINPGTWITPIGFGLIGAAVYYKNSKDNT